MPAVDGPELDGPRFGPAAGGAPAQLVVLLHGVGADGHDLIDLGPTWARALPHAAFVSPDAPEPYDSAPTGRQWFSLGERTHASRARGAAAAAPALGRLIDAELARLHLPADAYALVGFSQGAMMALYAGPRRRPPPRAIVAFSGLLIDPDGIPSGPLPPVLLIHGEADAIVPAEASRTAERSLRALGGAVELEITPRLGHGIDTAGLSRGGLFLQRAFAASGPGGA
jgi:phospholipase/carboxylesterase